MSIDLEDTIVALSSALGPGARAVIRLSGAEALPIAAAVFTGAVPDAPQRRCYPGQLRLPEVAAPVPVDLYFSPAPRTYTGQDLVELHMLSAPPLVELAIAALLNAGARMAQAGEFTMRAFLAGKLDLPRVEAVLGTIEARDRDELGQALDQLAGSVSQPLHELRDDLLNLLADLEAGLDFVDQEISFVRQDDLLHRVTKALAHLTLLQRQLVQRSVSGRPYRVVLAGLPNAGKSSLFNALAGDSAALVSPEPGTTRDYLVCPLTLEGLTVELIDTAGWQEATGAIEEQAQALGRAQTRQADLILLCADCTGPFDQSSCGHDQGPPVLIVATKCDLAAAPPGVLATSTVTGAGIDELRSLMAERARSQAPPPLAPSVSRCCHHVEVCLDKLRRAHELVLFEEPAELLAVELRGALDDLGALVGAVYTDDLLDRVFSRFCIGK